MRTPGAVTTVVSSSGSTTETERSPESATGLGVYTDAGLTNDEHCSISQALATTLGIGASEVGGVQIRITTSTGEIAVFTVEEIDASPTDDIGLNSDGFNKLDEGVATTLSGCTATTRVTWPGLLPALADPDEVGGDAGGLLAENVRDDGVTNTCIALAVHGGDIDANTDLQAEELTTQGGYANYILSGYSEPYGTIGTASASAGARWHITAVDMGFRSYPLLEALRYRGFTYCVSFHGMSDVSAAALGGGACDVIVGGNGPTQLKQDIVDGINAIANYTDTGQGGQGASGAFNCRLAVTDDSGFSGFNVDNICNRMTGSVAEGVFTASSGGVQLEQSVTVRAAFAQEIAQAVATAVAAY